MSYSLSQSAPPLEGTEGCIWVFKRRNESLRGGTEHQEMSIEGAGRELLCHQGMAFTHPCHRMNQFGKDL